ncbi:MAG: GNAT family N-acetyltransferase [Tepidiformaceae bacterium]
MQIPLTHAVLRPWTLDDAESLVRHANNENVSRWLRDRFPFPYTAEDAVSYVAGASTQAEPFRSFAIADAEGACGGISLQPQDDVHRLSAELGYWLGEERWGRGIVTEAVRQVTAYGFRELGLIRIYAGVFEGNDRSMSVLKKAGFELEARRRRAVVKHGQILDDYLFALVRPDTP